jgi:formylglycine-generating enzyme required for sulfatase activity
MVLVPGGYFQMGAAAESLVEECNLFREGCATDWFAPSEPIHEVLLGRYYIDAHEVTNAAYAVFLNEAANENLCLDHDCLDETQSELRMQDGRYGVVDGTGSNPMAGVTWFGAAAYCEWRDARLPTEAEWEKAAAWDRSGAIARHYPWGDTFDGGKVNFCDASCMEPQAHTDYNDGFPSVAPVMSFEAGRSTYGTYDMAGNVWEWVADWYDPNYYAQSPVTNPPGAASGEARVVRGGSWFDTGNFTAATIRFPSSPENADRTIGFRCATDMP